MKKANHAAYQSGRESAWAQYKQPLRVLIAVLFAYFLQVCVMEYIPVNGTTGSVLFAVLAAVIVCTSKTSAYMAGCVVGIMAESMLKPFPVVYGLGYPVLALIWAQAFSDMSDRKLERKSQRKNKQPRQSGSRRHLLHKLFRTGKNMKVNEQRETFREVHDASPHLRIPFCAAAMDGSLSAVLCIYLLLTGVDLSWSHAVRLLTGMAYTFVIAFVLMWGLIPFLKPDETRRAFFRRHERN